MKKTIIKLFLFFVLLCITCFYIYQLTENKTRYYLTIGDSIANNPYMDNYNNLFTKNEYRIIDLIDILKYNKEKSYISLHQLLKKTDYLTISIGMNDLYYILDEKPKDIYLYIDKIINNYEELLKIINKYTYKKVYILGYYNVSNNYQDIFTYANYCLKKLSTKYHYTFINTDKIINNNQNFLVKDGDFTLNNRGYYQIYQVLVEKLSKY